MSADQRNFWLRFVFVVVSTLVAFGVVEAVRRRGLFEVPELRLQDALGRAVARHGPTTTRSPVVLVRVGESDIRKLRHYPVTDDELAKVVETAMAANAAVVGFDIYRDIEMPPGHDALTRVLSEQDRVIAVELFGNHKKGAETYDVPAPAALRAERDQVGFSDLALDSDGYVRRALIYQSEGDGTGAVERYGHSLAYQLAYTYFESLKRTQRFGEDIGGVTIPPVRAGDGAYVTRKHVEVGGFQVLIGDSGGMPESVKFCDVLDGKVPAEVFAGRIVLIGVTAESVGDMCETGLWGRIYGCELQARVTQYLVRIGLGEIPAVRAMGDETEMLLVLAAALLSSLLSLVVRSPVSLVITIVAALAVLVAVGAAGQRSGYVIPVLPEGVAFVAAIGLVGTYKLSEQRRQWATLATLFKGQVSAQVMKEIWNQRDGLLQKGTLPVRMQTATVLFTDLKGFTSTTQGMREDRLFEWLNRYLTAMAHQVEVHNGFVDKFIGDAVMGVFGVPLGGGATENKGRHAIDAVNSALAMRAELEQLNRQFEAEGLPTMTLRVGIHTGRLLAGCVGGGSRIEYTVIGDSVNIASRLESCLKDRMGSDVMWGACRVLISEETAATVSSEGGRFDVVECGEVMLSGMSRPTRVFAVRGVREGATVEGRGSGAGYKGA